MALFNILVDIAARTASLESGINSAVAGIERLTAVAETAKSALETTFVGISFVGLLEGLTHTIDGIEQIGRSAEKANVTVEAFSALDYAAKQVGVSTESLSKGFKLMEKAIADAGDGVAKPRNALEDLGVDLGKLQKLTPDKQFEVLAQAISRVEDPARKMQIELALFGRAGNDLAPLFEKGAAGIEALIEKAKEMGVVLDAEGTKKATEAAEATKSLASAWQAFTRQLAIETAPTLTIIADKMRQMLGGSTNTERIAQIKAQLEDMRPLMESISQGGKEVQIGHAPEIERWNQLTAELLKLTAASKQAADETAANLAKVNDALKPPAEDTRLADMLDWIKELKAELSNQKIPSSHLDELFKGFDRETQTGVEKTTDEITKLKGILDELYADGLIGADEYNKRWKELADRLLPDVEVKSKMTHKEIREDFDVTTEFMKSAAHSIQQSMANFLFDPFSQGVRGMVSGFINAIRRMVAEIAANSVLKNVFGFGAGSKDNPNTGFAGWIQSAINGLFGGTSSAGGGATDVGEAEQSLGVTGYASGGTISGPAIVGEQGPELWTPPSSGGSISPSGTFGAGPRLTLHFSPQINIDSRSDRVQVLHDVTTIVKQAQRDTVTLMMDAMNRNGYPPLRY